MKQQLTNLEQQLKKLEPQPISNITKQLIMEEIEQLEQQAKQKTIPIQKILLQIAAIVIVLLSIVIVQQKQNYNKIKNTIAQQPIKSNKNIDGIPLGTKNPDGTIPRNNKQYQRVSTNTYLVSQQDEGIVRVSAQTAPLRKVRYKLIDQVKYQNNNREYMVTQPREQIMYISTNSL